MYRESAERGGRDKRPVRPSAVTLTTAGLIVAFLAPLGTAAEEVGEHHHGKLMMPEPLLDESITDVDSTEPRQLEVDLIGGTLTRIGAARFAALFVVVGVLSGIALRSWQVSRVTAVTADAAPASATVGL